MKTIRVMIDATLLRACERAARKANLNRSELVRLARRAYFQRVEILDSEQRDQLGYEKLPQSPEELSWEADVLWPQA